MLLNFERAQQASQLSDENHNENFDFSSSNILFLKFWGIHVHVFQIEDAWLHGLWCPYPFFANQISVMRNYSSYPIFVAICQM